MAKLHQYAFYIHKKCSPAKARDDAVCDVKCYQNHPQSALPSPHTNKLFNYGHLQGRINHSGAPYQRKAGALFSYVKPGFSYLWRCTFFPKKVDDLFLVVVAFKRTMNVQTSKQRGKNLAADRRGALRRGPPPMVQPAQWIIRPWSSDAFACVLCSERVQNSSG